MLKLTEILDMLARHVMIAGDQLPELLEGIEGLKDTVTDATGKQTYTFTQVPSTTENA